MVRHLIRILDEAQPFGVEHRLDAGENANGNRYRLLITERVWNLPGHSRVGLNVLSEGTLILVDTYSS